MIQLKLSMIPCESSKEFILLHNVPIKGVICQNGNSKQKTGYDHYLWNDQKEWQKTPIAY